MITREEGVITVHSSRVTDRVCRLIVYHYEHHNVCTVLHFFGGGRRQVTH